MIPWRRVPWPLWVFTSIALFEAVRLEVRVHGPVVAMIIYPVLAFVWLYLMLRGVRWVWLVTVAFVVLGFGIELIGGSVQWWGAIIGLVEPGLLLLPVTQRYFSPDKTPPNGDASLDNPS